MLIGLTGTYGSGKSTVAAIFEEAGDKVIDADAISRQVVQSGQPALEEIKNIFGPGVMNADGALDRKAMADIVFNKPESRKRLEGIIHPRVRIEMEEQIEQARQAKKYPNIVLNVPLLYETGLDRMCQRVVVVTISESERFRRLRQRDKADENEVVRRLGAQWSQSLKARQADAVIDNSGSIDATRQQVLAIRQEWM